MRSPSRAHAGSSRASDAIHPRRDQIALLGTGSSECSDLVGAAAPNLIQADPQHAVTDKNQATGRFLLLMVSLSPVDLAITGIFVAVSERKGAFAAVTEPIARYGGVINQFQGDAMLVTFNVPVVDPFHADHAVLAARPAS